MSMPARSAVTYLLPEMRVLHRSISRAFLYYYFIYIGHGQVRGTKTTGRGSEWELMKGAHKRRALERIYIDSLARYEAMNYL